MNKQKNKKAFTLIELIIVIGIVAILATIGTMSFFSYIKDANDTKRTTDIQTIKIHLDNYKRNHSSLYPTVNTVGTTQIFAGSELVANQSFFDEYLAGKVSLVKLPIDPLINKQYLYSVSKDRLTYQITATLENKENLVAFDGITEKAYAEESNAGLIAYVEGNFIPKNKNMLPGLLYSIKTGVETTFDINTNDSNGNPNIAKVILNGQNQNLAYNMNGVNVALGTNLSDVLASVSIIENSSITSATNSCTGIINTNEIYYNGENDILYMSGITIGSQMGWKYKTCDGNTGIMQPSSDFYYNCTNIGEGAKFSLDCIWLGCDDGYSVRTDGVPGCTESVTAPILASPSNGAYNIPISGILSWNYVKGTNIRYKVYLATATSDFTNVSTQSTNSYSYSNLNYATTYKWKVEACESGICKESNTFTFSTIMSADGGTSTTSTTTTVTDPSVENCESGNITCTADDVVISYMGTSGTPLDGTKDNFGVSPRNGSNYYGNEKVLQYKIQNNSDGRAKFKVKLAKSGATLDFKRHANNSFDDSDAATIIDIGGEQIANNLFWKYGNGCIYNTITGGYEVVGKTSCLITIHARSDSTFNPLSTIIGSFMIVNIDPLSTWISTAYTSATSLKMATSGYDMPAITTQWAYHSQQELEPSLDIGNGNFGTSTRIGTGDYGYWKGLTYRLVNSDSRDSYFKMGFSGTGTEYIGAYGIPANYYFNMTILENSILVEDDINNFIGTKSIDLQSNGIGNVYWRNDTCPTSPTGIGIGKGFKVPASGSCEVTFYYRADFDQPYRNKNVFSITLLNQPIANKDYNSPNLTLKANTAGWINDCSFAGTSLFNGLCYFK